MPNKREICSTAQLMSFRTVTSRCKVKSAHSCIAPVVDYRSLFTCVRRCERA